MVMAQPRPSPDPRDVRRRLDPRQHHETGREPKTSRPTRCCPASRSTPSATDFAPIEQLQMMRFKGEKWDMFGEVISGEAVTH